MMWMVEASEICVLLLVRNPTYPWFEANSWIQPQTTHIKRSLTKRPAALRALASYPCILDQFLVGPLTKLSVVCSIIGVTRWPILLLYLLPVWRHKHLPLAQPLHLLRANQIWPAQRILSVLVSHLQSFPICLLIRAR
jgi:hypothetical protein